MIARKQPAPPTARPGSVTRDGGDILVVCARTGKAYTVARVGTYRGAAAVHGWPWGTLEGIILSHGLLYGARGWAHPDAERAALKVEADQVRQLELIAPTSCARCGRVYGREKPAPHGLRSHGMCGRCAQRWEQELEQQLAAAERTMDALGLQRRELSR